MNKPKISVNQFSEFAMASEKGRLSIVRNQKKPNSLLIPWYQGAKGSIKRFLRDAADLAPLYEGIQTQIERRPANKRQEIDRTVSIEALQKLISMKAISVLHGFDYEIIKPTIIAIELDGVEINLSPEILIKVRLRNGRCVLGGVKIHISKRKPFDQTQCKYVATLLAEYLKTNYAAENESVDSRLCLCIDVFGERIVPANASYSEELEEIRMICKEFKQLWMKVA